MTSRGKRGRIVSLRFEFLPRKDYKDKFSAAPAEILHYFEKRFVHKVLLPVLNLTVRDRVKKSAVESFEEVTSKPKSRHTSGEEEEEDRGNEHILRNKYYNFIFYIILKH